MKKRYIVLFAIIVTFAYLKINTNEEHLLEDELPENVPPQITKIDSIKSAEIKSNNLPPQEKIEEAKRPYLTKNEFEKIKSEVAYSFKQVDKDLSIINQSEDKVEILFGKEDEDFKDIDNLLYNLNVNLTGRIGEYRAFFNKEKRQIEIQQLDDFLVNLSEEINSKSKNITNVKLEYETPLDRKPLTCVTGEEYVIQEKFHIQNNCSANSLSHSQIKKIIENFYKNGTLDKNMNNVQSEILPLWNEFYGKSEDLILGNQHLFLCYPNSNTIWMEIGCNFRLKIIQKKI